MIASMCDVCILVVIDHDVHDAVSSINLYHYDFFVHVLSTGRVYIFCGNLYGLTISGNDSSSSLCECVNAVN